MIAPSAPLLSRLAYVGITTRRLAEWDTFARRVLGLHVERPSDRQLRLRLDAKLCRLLVQEGDSDGASFFGWEIADGRNLEDIQRVLLSAGVESQMGSSRACAERGVDRFLWLTDPMGHRVEICAHHQSAPAPAELRFERPLGGFKTGVLGLGHAVLMSENVEDARRFYTGVLGMRLSDYTEKPFDAHFYHVNARHHSFAIIQNKRQGLHHIMLELLEFDDVGQTYDLLDAEGVRLGASLGRHTNDFMTSFYMFTPSEFMIEYGWGGRQIDMKHWQPERLDCGPSFWGHERTWLDEATRREAAELRIAAARRGLKAKVVVTPGHFVEALGEKSS